ncbi:hypothetical protein N8768_07485 [Flavobacteriaceae bacterium]|jgi:hypothetical protein|nr:hypothetical protein [Flavobacteriaceae bacterium]
MKKLLTTIFLLSAILTMAQKTVSMHMYINVAPENQEKFERLEIDYWSKVAQEEIKKGNMTGWGLMKNIGLNENNADANYLIVNTFKDLEQAFSNQANWDTSMLGVTPEDISTENIREVKAIRWYQNESSIDGNSTNFTIFNYARPTSVADFVNENKNIYRDIHISMQKSTKLDSWGVHTRIHPKGTASKASIFTRDGFSTLLDAMEYLSYKDDNPYQKMASKSKMSEILPDGFGYTIIRETLLWVN